MGTGANVYVHPGEDPGVYLYTHWARHYLPACVREALRRSQDRWGDDAYLARIIFSEMLGDDLYGTTGYGISAYAPDGRDWILDVDTVNKTVGMSIRGKFVKVWTFEQYATTTDPVHWEDYDRESVDHRLP